MTANRLPHWILLLTLVCSAGFFLPDSVTAQDVAAPGEMTGETPGENLTDPATSETGEGSYLILTICVLVTLIFSFLCSVAEAVLLSVTRPFIATLKEKGGKSGEILAELKADINRPLAAILTLNTIAHTLGAAGAGAAAAALWLDPDVEANNRMGLYIGFNAVFVFLILFGSEIIPKTLGATYWRGLAPVTGYFTKWLIWALYPLVVVSEFLTKRMSGSGHGQSFSRDELSAMAEMAGESGQLEKQESSMLRSLFRFRKSTTSDIMTPRTVVFSLPETITVAEYVAKHSESPFSRIPIYGKSNDDITGFVLRMEILFASVKGNNDMPLKELRRPINAVPATVSLMNAFDSLVTKREHILLVVGEFGSVQGIVTLEDIVETLLGLEIMDEVDENKDMQKLARDLWDQRARRSGIIRESAPKTDGPVPPKTDTAVPPKTDTAVPPKTEESAPEDKS